MLQRRIKHFSGYSIKEGGGESGAVGEPVDQPARFVIQSELVANETQPKLSDDPRVAAVLDNPLKPRHVASVSLEDARASALQFRYLFGGQAWVSRSLEMGWGEYARRGFFELVAVAVIAVGVAVAIDRLTRSRTSWLIGVSVATGAFCSALAGWFGMSVATHANVRVGAVTMRAVIVRAVTVRGVILVCVVSHETLRTGA